MRAAIRRSLALIAVLALGLSVAALRSPTAFAAQTCNVATTSTNDVVQICITAPSAGATLSGPTTVTATTTTVTVTVRRTTRTQLLQLAKKCAGALAFSRTLAGAGLAACTQGCPGKRVAISLMHSRRDNSGTDWGMFRGRMGHAETRRTRKTWQVRKKLSTTSRAKSSMQPISCTPDLDRDCWNPSMALSSRASLSGAVYARLGRSMSHSTTTVFTSATACASTCLSNPASSSRSNPSKSSFPFTRCNCSPICG